MSFDTLPDVHKPGMTESEDRDGTQLVTELHRQDKKKMVSDEESLSLPTPPYVQITAGIRVSIDPVDCGDTRCETNQNRPTKEKKVSDKNILSLTTPPSVQIPVVCDDSGLDTEQYRKANECTVSDNEDMSLPTPPYVGLRNTNTDSPVSKKLRVESTNCNQNEIKPVVQMEFLTSNASVQSQPDSQLEEWETWKMSRDQLIDYCQRNSLPQNFLKQARSYLINIVSKHLIESFTKNVTPSRLSSLLNQFGIKPHTALKRRVGQVKSLFTKNQQFQSQILKNLKSDEANLSNFTMNVPVLQIWQR